MNDSELDAMIRRVTQGIGEGRPDKDWKVVPTEHAEHLQGVAPELTGILSTSRVKGLAEQYEELNQKAVASRDKFKASANWLNRCVFATASLGAILLILGTLNHLMQNYGRPVIVAIGILGIVSGALATLWLNRMRQGRQLRAWFADRAKAEGKRLAYFKELLLHRGSPTEALWVFEYTRRFLLDNQIDYFKERGAKHESGAESALKTASIAAFLASICTTVASLLSGYRTEFTAIASLGVIASAYAALAASKTEVSQDRRSAERYRLAGERLQDWKLNIDDYRKRVAGGDQDAIEEFYGPVFQTLVSDHKSWLEVEEKIAAAVGQFERRLKEAQRAPMPE